MIWCDHATLSKFMYSVTKNGSVSNWSQEIHAITPYTDFEHTKGKENVLVDTVSRLRTLGLYKVNEPEKEGKSMANQFSI